MINYGKVKSSIRPLEMEIIANNVYLASNIEEYQEESEERIIYGFEYDYVSYTKDEYILMMSNKQKEIDALREELEAAKIILGVE